MHQATAAHCVAPHSYSKKTGLEAQCPHEEGWKRNHQCEAAAQYSVASQDAWIQRCAGKRGTHGGNSASVHMPAVSGVQRCDRKAASAWGAFAGDDADNELADCQTGTPWQAAKAQRSRWVTARQDGVDFATVYD